jgi:hypothetical protein
MKRAAGQRLADGLVILLLIFALAGGWALKVSAENRTVPYDLDGLHLKLPSGGRIVEMENGVRSVDLTGSIGSTRFEVQNQPLQGAVSIPQALLAASDALTMERARIFTAYRTLEVDEVPLQGEVGLLVSYTFVEENPNALSQQLPVVMRGEDRLSFLGSGTPEAPGRLLIFTVQAEVSRFAEAQRQFRALCDSAWLEGGK